ncbi:hypothetical protein Q4Q35_21330 [Flavivirga aquimarina]|uniref:Lipoprotein n=1 Tax=Flavivirga aquimarina TaxID=2027862 RepID=A0ABT8WGR6_9FLAO|nr:hypothetical protein [Flavivirga aquimarina]MDO5972351.1 hypothetical protein [Flavivirga aquimarina]
MQNLKKSIAFLIILTSLVSCGGKTKKENLSENKGSTETPVEEAPAIASYDLTEKGIPTIIQAPSGAEIKKGMGGAEVDGVKTTSLLISNGKFKLEVNMDSEASGMSLEELVAYYKEVSEEDEGFEIVKEEANGFIYKTAIGGDVDYFVDYIKMNDKGESIEMNSGFSMSEYSLEEAEKIFEAAKTATWK